MVDLAKRYDVLVIGGGNAVLCAAITARRRGCSVLVLEAAPKFYRGGNTRHTRNIRVAHDGPSGLMTGAYPEEEFWADLQRVTGGETDEHLARRMIRLSKELQSWLGAQGVHFQAPLQGSIGLDRTNAFFLGGGRAMLNALYRTALGLGVEALYDAEVVNLVVDGNRFVSAIVETATGRFAVEATSLVAAAGGFEANLEWLKQYWGDKADNFIIRGTPYNRGRVLRILLDNGIEPVGDPTQCHAVALDVRAPRFDGGIITRLDSIVYGIVVNRDSQRFYDEDEDMWPKRYAIWGRLIAAEPGQIAFSIHDARMEGRFIPPPFPAIKADTIPELAVKLGLDGAALAATVAAFNEAVRPGTFDTTKLDDCRTEGLELPKTHWATPLDRPPFSAYPLRPGITFTYLGTRVDDRGRILMAGGAPSANMFAAGEIMAGNILGKGYLAGIGMTIGGVSGRVAGEGAAAHAFN